MADATYPGRRIVVAAWTVDLAFAAVAIPQALGPDTLDRDTLDRVAVAVSVVLFVVSIGVWAYALGVAVARSARGDDLAVSSLFLLEGAVPRRVRLHLFGALGACLALVALTAASNPFGVLVPMLPLGLCGLWGARHGRYPLRRPTLRSRGPSRHRAAGPDGR